MVQILHLRVDLQCLFTDTEAWASLNTTACWPVPMIWEAVWNSTSWIPGCHDRAEQGFLYTAVEKVNKGMYLLEE